MISPSSWFPVSLCFAMTINKAQGQTLRSAGVDLTTSCFSHGQLYVALSRVKSMGVGGQLAPFFKCVCVYFVALGVSGEAAPSAGAAACKCAPVLCLLAALLWRRAALPAGRRRYASLVSLGLSLSALGDALLVWPQLLAAGMCAFGAAHAAYAAAFGWAPLRARAGAVAYAATAAYLTQLSPPAALRPLVPLYALLLATTAWRGAALGGAAAAGAALFLLSDAILGYSLFAGPVPHKQVLVMSTYYTAQLGIAYSALREPRDAAAAAVTADDAAAPH